ncbi:MAG TPA: ABC transporter permease [Blastocatellia bacterium]|nr:ABC transporter permease [Blastocatellia bacterium]
MPEWKQEIRQRLASLKLEPTREAEIVEELAQHLDDCYAELLAGGMSQAEAERRTRADLSDRELLQQELRRIERQVVPEPLVLGMNRRSRVIVEVWTDLRYGARMLVKNPGFTLIAVLTLALGIGVNTAVFSVVNAVMLKPLPVARPDELVSLYTSDFSGPRYGASSYRDYLDMRDRAEVLDGLIAYWRQTVSLRRGGQAEEFINADIVTGNFFDVVGVRPAVGRTFLPEEDRTPGTHAVAVMSYGCWQRRFGSDPNLVGTTITINNLGFTVIGIVPPEFAGIVRGISCDIWIPMMMTPGIAAGDDSLENRGARVLSVLGRLKPGVTLQQAQADLAVVAEQQRAAYPQQWTDLRGEGRLISVLPESQSRIPPWARDTALGVTGLVMAVMGLVLAVACANLAGLLLARAVTRQKEMAIRLSLGASRWRLIRQLLCESLLVTVVGGMAGAFVVWQGLDLAIGLAPPLAVDLSLDARVLVFALAVSLITTLAFGLAPALQATRFDPIAALKDESGVSGYRRSRLRSGLVVAQIAISVLLLSVSGLFLRSLMKAGSIDPGFNPKNVLLVEMLPRDYQETNGGAFYQQILERLRSLPGVSEVSLVNRAGLDFDGTRRNVNIEGYARQRDEDMELAFNLVGPNYFHTMQTPLLGGRDFNERDVRGAPGVVIINETLARRYFPGQEALGKRLSVSGPDGPFLEIIGITRDGKYWSLFEEPRPFFSLPLLQQYQGFAVLVLRAERDPRLLIETVRQEILEQDRNLSITSMTTMTEHIGMALLPLRIAGIGSIIFGGLALLLAAIGIYGLTAYFARQRTHEIGVRLALGAQRKDILRLVLNHGIVIVLIGIGLGIAAAFATTRLLASFLFGVSATDALTFAGVATALAIVALLACWIPARRAMKVDPMVALRYE